ncbi:hypothetical protein DIPPA_17663 [Diplonema papillatum]|nr:hypothetical protein DIPPA_17663 [Diplonema papillatum]
MAALSSSSLNRSASPGSKGLSHLHSGAGSAGEEARSVGAAGGSGSWREKAHGATGAEKF